MIHPIRRRWVSWPRSRPRCGGWPRWWPGRPAGGGVRRGRQRRSGGCFRVDLANMCRYEPDRTATFVATWGPAGERFPVGSRWPLKGDNLSALVFDTGRPARLDRYADSSSGPLGAAAREAGIRSAVGAPIIVEGNLWGAILRRFDPGAAAAARTPRRGWPRSPSWWRRRSPTPTAAPLSPGWPRSRPRCGGWRRWWRAGRRQRRCSRRSLEEVGRLLPSRSGDHGAATSPTVRYLRRDLGHGGRPLLPLAAGGAPRGTTSARSCSRPAVRPGSTAMPMASGPIGAARREVGHPLVGRDADHRRGAPVGRDGRRFDPGAAAAAGRRGAPGLVHRAGGDGHRQRREPRRADGLPRADRRRRR